MSRPSAHRRGPRPVKASVPVDAFHDAPGDTRRPICGHLDAAGLARLREATLELLAGHGVAVAHEAAAGRLRGAGAREGRETGRRRGYYATPAGAAEDAVLMAHDPL